jgi:hypothetical protein
MLHAVEDGTPILYAIPETRCIAALRRDVSLA